MTWTILFGEWQRHEAVNNLPKQHCPPVYRSNRQPFDGESDTPISQHSTRAILPTEEQRQHSDVIRHHQLSVSDFLNLHSVNTTVVSFFSLRLSLVADVLKSDQFYTPDTHLPNDVPWHRSIGWMPSYFFPTKKAIGLHRRALRFKNVFVHRQQC